jgi:hypothetical protein
MRYRVTPLAFVALVGFGLALLLAIFEVVLLILKHLLAVLLPNILIRGRGTIFRIPQPSEAHNVRLGLAKDLASVALLS